jgi:hypothetical protein
VVNSRVFFSDPERNNVVMKYDQPELYERLERGIEDDHNLIINNGSTRVYSSLITSTGQDAEGATAEEEPEE